MNESEKKNEAEIKEAEIKEKKKALRKQLKEITGSLTKEYRKTASDIIAEKCIKSEEFKAAGSIFIFISMAGEPDTSKIIRAAFDAHKEVFVPRCLKDGVMEAIRITSFDCLKPGHYGIPEPDASIKPTAVEEFDDESTIAFVPCVAATADGKRMGHGAGYYDRFLEDRKMQKHMLVFGKQLLDDIPCDEHDILMDMVVSEL